MMQTEEQNPKAQQGDRPAGRREVETALKEAVLELLAERGTSFSVREIAKRAQVNHGLVYRHFGSKQALITAALADRNEQLRQQVVSNKSPMDLGAIGGPATAVLLARLILDDLTSLIPDHTATAAIVERSARLVNESDPLTAAHRAALANIISLGWAVFGQYAIEAADAPSSKIIQATLNTIVQDLLEGKPISRSQGPAQTTKVRLEH